MLANFWRTSHLLLAVFSSLFLLIASVTGVILSTEPIVKHFNSPSDKTAVDSLSLAQLIPTLKDEYIEVFSLSVDEENAVKVDVIGFDESADGAFYINPNTGKKIADILPKSEFYTWTTTLHRSLFMHSTGRILMGITVFLLLLMALSGIALVIKRTHGIRNIFKHIKKQNSAQYYHTIYGRLSFIPIVIIAFSGTIMFLNTQFKPDKNTTIHRAPKVQENIELNDFLIFQQTKLSEVVTLNFPFSSEEEDYYELELHNKTIKIHQYTGEIVEEQQATWIQNLYSLSTTLHTGKGQWVWAVILGLISLNLLYFIYSGFKISWKRLASKTKNKISPDEAEFIILIGSENGSTRKFGQLLFLALTQAGKSVFITDMNHFQYFPKAKYLMIMTSTYGDGEAPFNARLFLSKIAQVEQKNKLETHIIGFGSMVYPKFCQYAVDVYNTLSKHDGFVLSAPPIKIDGRSYTSFSLAIDEWKKQHNITLDLPSEKHIRPAAITPFKVIQKQEVHDGYTLTFTLELLPQANVQFQSGDLLAITPPSDDLARYYSIGKTEENNILLSVKKHDLGECSNYLYNLKENDEISAYIKINRKFHLPKKGDVLMIANGTGIAPFLGMTSMYTNQKKIFFLGGRNPSSFKLYHKIIQQNKSTELFNTLHFALSKEDGNNRYVQDLVRENKDLVAQLLKKKGSIMICGSLKMRDGVLKELKNVLKEKKMDPLEKFIEKDKILIDCY